MIAKKTAGLLLGALILTSSTVPVDAGWPFSRKSDCCPVCEQEQPKQKKKSIIGADPAPAAGVADVVPARLTNVRAEKKKDEPEAAAADNKKVQDLEKKFNQLDLRVNELSLEIEALVHVLENQKAAPTKPAQ